MSTSAETRAAIIAAMETGLNAPAAARQFGVSEDTARNFFNEATASVSWPDLPSNAFEDDPRACRPMPGRTIFSQGRAA